MIPDRDSVPYPLHGRSVGPAQSLDVLSQRHGPGSYPMAAMVKIGDTVADIEEGLNAGMWTIGLIMSGNELGLPRDQVESMNAAETGHEPGGDRDAVSRGRRTLYGPGYLGSVAADSENRCPACQGRAALVSRIPDLSEVDVNSRRWPRGYPSLRVCSRWACLRSVTALNRSWPLPIPMYHPCSVIIKPSYMCRIPASMTILARSSCGRRRLSETPGDVVLRRL